MRVRDRFLPEWVASREVSAAVGLVGSSDRVWWVGSAGAAAVGDPNSSVDPATRFDLASLTKPFVASLALALDASGLLPLDLALGELFPQADQSLTGVSMAELLCHRGGLQAWTALYARCQSRDGVLPLLLSGELGGAQAGTYSDLGYVLWGLAAEKTLGRPVSELLSAHVLDPLGLDGVGPSPGAQPDVAACDLSNGREMELAAAQGIEVALVEPPTRGQVQDGNARFMGGMAGHAGLFAPVQALWCLAREWLRPGLVLQPEGVEAAFSEPGSYALGWARAAHSGAGGAGLGHRAFGHTGFTGSSLWVDPETDAIRVLLAHRSSPFSDLDPRRREFYLLTSGMQDDRSARHRDPS